MPAADLWRSIFHPPARGSWNMAVDEALLRSCASGASGPVLRLYAWAPPALSLGAHQEADRAADRGWLAENGYDLVRRPTGGRAVLHAQELTYAVVAPAGDAIGGITAVYRTVARGLLAGLRSLGIEAELVRGKPSEDPSEGLQPCFTSPARYELLWRGRKLIGSAQRRVEGAWLQHGSIPISPDEEGVRRATGSERLPGGWMAGLEEAAGRPLDLEEIASALEDGFRDLFGSQPQRGGLTTEEARAADELERRKYATDDWTLHRRLPATPGAAKDGTV